MSGSTSSSSSPLDQSSSNNSKELRTEKLEGLTENKCNYSVKSESDTDDESLITDEEYKRYSDAVKASDGFDVPRLTGGDFYYGGGIVPLRMCDYYRTTLEPFCVAAMNHYNQDKKTNYEFVRLIKANDQVLGCFINYYLTIEGRTSENSTKIFEAIVTESLGDPEVQFCREKAPPTETGNAEGSSGK
ncbi:hypothetical protein F3Y22_tig00110505pilonHSYRG00214 [Hibiscus syriacus]|uniref:Cystatin domain-containing protein n=1 Tax=Hibiscus syriacus TaxID=106335 RepID=A0A6A3ABE1_HIBSY|nr:uncharacterized protein LOC120129865 [Hibiscus syriacus]KAE8701804.1 hypothetical protein F3Y22_tig00110505pilonHSYRG00214 [Hibiscus syriacus]